MSEEELERERNTPQSINQKAKTLIEEIREKYDAFLEKYPFGVNDTVEVAKLIDQIEEVAEADKKQIADLLAEVVNQACEYENMMESKVTNLETEKKLALESRDHWMNKHAKAETEIKAKDKEIKLVKNSLEISHQLTSELQKQVEAKEGQIADFRKWLETYPILPAPIDRQHVIKKAEEVFGEGQKQGFGNYGLELAIGEKIKEQKKQEKEQKK